jgi:hypothetical protein
VPSPNNPNIIKFDSMLEFKTFQILKSFFILDINLFIHHKIELFPNKFWRVDFFVKVKSYSILIESKGFITREFRLQLDILRHFNPIAFNKLIIVSDNKDVLDKFQRLGIKNVPLSDLKNFLSSYIQSVF